jgi:hypothetical protein
LALSIFNLLPNYHLACGMVCFFSKKATLQKNYFRAYFSGDFGQDLEADDLNNDLQEDNDRGEQARRHRLPQRQKRAIDEKKRSDILRDFFT